jgi:uncharacterized protein YggU (UPF0235/DUF167 family)
MWTPKSAVSVQRGGQSRTKILEATRLSEDERKAHLTDL